VKIPLVESNLVAPGSDIPARLQVEHLVAHGHERLGYLTTSEPSLQRFATPRTDGFVAACAEFNLPAPRVAALPGGLQVTVESVAEQLKAWQSEPHPVTAVACFNDFHAAVCLAAATDLGWWVPDDLAVMGLDDDIFAPLTRPALTSVKLDPQGLARHLWATAQYRLHEALEPHPYVMDARIIQRASVSDTV
jgi:DNA-binding LacI/PurR family transcriptional regulator